MTDAGTRSVDVDGGWAWVVLGSGVGSLFIVGFLGYSGGMITAAMLEVFGGEVSTTSAVAAFVPGFMSSSGPVAGFIINRFGCRLCTILGGIISMIGLAGASLSDDLFSVMWTYGVLTGTGYGLAYTAAIVKVGYNFHRLRPIAAGITVAGAGVGMFVGPPVMQFLIDHYGLRGAFLISAGISSHFCVFGGLMRPLPKQEVTNESEGDKRKRTSFSFRKGSCYKKIKKEVVSFVHIFKNAGFLMYIGSTFCWNIAESASFLHLPSYCVKQGSSKRQTSLLYTVMGIVNIFARILVGFAANDEGISTVAILFGLMSITGVCTILFPFYSRSYGGQMLYAAVLGIYSSSSNTLMSPLAVELVGIQDLATAFGLISLLAGAGYLTGPPIAGAIVDHGATYRESYIFAGAVYLVSGLFAILIPLVHHQQGDQVMIDLHRDGSIIVDNANENTACMVEMTESSTDIANETTACMVEIIEDSVDVVNEKTACMVETIGDSVGIASEETACIVETIGGGIDIANEETACKVETTEDSVDVTNEETAFTVETIEDSLDVANEETACMMKT